MMVDLVAHMSDRQRLRRILVTGSRKFGDYALLTSALDRLSRENSDYFPPERGGMPWWPFDITIIVGDAKGADEFAYSWARQRRCIIERYPAQWLTHGSMAGRVRNTAMLYQGKPDVVVAFHPADHIGKGTAHMMRMARERRVPVIELRART